ncbi:alpha/beta-hydrolase N-terminal domain-containing protein [Nocardia vaccinii]|uniref:alpha/beta-hydrolase N-terminal domain-containing protein n=1 Tax=Nocardia vaccinii TaxID=1822 RepID=UPI0008362FEC|nr:alpha/beta-hydrolase N-terminal domain-containing protein [Nocardia vaccinii]
MSRIRPRVGTIVAVTIAAVVSLLPAVLPRTSPTQAVLTGVLVAVAIGIAGLGRIVLRRRGIDVEARWGHHRVPVLLLCGFAVIAATVNASHWQSGLRADMGMAPIGPVYWLRAAVGTAVLAAILVGASRGLRWVMRKMSGADRRLPAQLPTPALPEVPAAGDDRIDATPAEPQPAVSGQVSG